MKSWRDKVKCLACDGEGVILDEIRSLYRACPVCHGEKQCDHDHMIAALFLAVFKLETRINHVVAWNEKRKS